MTKRSALTFLSAAAVFFLSGTVAAQTHNIKSTLAIADRVEVPGAILEPGTYLVRVAEVQSDRNTVVFQSLDGTKTFATAIATPHPDAQPKEQTEFVFYPTPSGENRVLRSWFPPNDRFAGQDFVYSADRMAALRRLGTEETPASTTASTVTTERTETSTRPPEMVPATPPPPPAPAPAPEPVTRTADMSTSTEASLPHTASPVPAIGSLGLVFLAAGTFLRRRRV